jgi:hypothetical protein
VHIFDDDEQRVSAGQLFEGVMNGLEEVRPSHPFGLSLVSIGEESPPRHQPRHSRMCFGQRRSQGRGRGGDPTEDLGEWEIRQGGVTEVDAVTHDHPPAVALRTVAQLTQEPGFADPRVASKQHSA